jgi:large subunit ribosomal protein L6
VTTGAEKGSASLHPLEGIDNELLGQVCAKIRSFRKPEPYKGKGIIFKGEIKFAARLVKLLARK